MKTIKISDKEIVIKKEFNDATCIHSTNGHNIDNFEEYEIKFGQKIFNVKFLETDSIIYTLTPESKSYFVSLSQLFGFPSNEDVSDIIKLQDIISKSQDRITDIYKNIEQISYEPLFK